METSYLKTLELDKIIARAAEGCVCKESREKLLAIEPQCDPDEVRYALEQTDAINSLLIKNGSPRFGVTCDDEYRIKITEAVSKRKKFTDNI